MRRWILLITIFIFASLYWYHLHQYKTQAQHARYEHLEGILDLEGEVVEQTGKNAMVRITRSSQTFQEGETILLRLYEEENLSSHISFSVDLSENQFRSFKNQHFDYDRYLYAKAITKFYHAKTVREIPGGSTWNRIRMFFRKAVETSMDSIPHPELLKTLVLGFKNEYEYYDRFQKLGISHLLVVSGLHFTILYRIVRKFVNVLRNTLMQSAICLVFMLMLYYLVNDSYSAMRAMTTITILELQRLRKKRVDILTAQSLCLLWILLLRPYAVLSTSLHLSFYTYLLIAFGFQKLSTGKSKLFTVFQSSLFIQIATIPITLNFFGEFNLYSIVANLLCVPMFAVLVPLAFLSVLISFIPILSVVFGAIWSFAVELLEFLVNAAPLDSMTIHIHSFELYVLCLVLLLLTFVFRFLYKKKIVFFICAVLLLVPIPMSPVEVIVPDVGHGDVTYIRIGGIVGMIDTGDGKMNVVTFLKSRGIRFLDYLIITHAHKDHVGGLANLLQEIRVDRVYLTRNSLEKLVNEMEQWDGRIIEITDSQTVELSKNGVTVTLILNRFRCETDENDNGITVQIEANEFRCAVFGDASTHIIEALPLKGRYDFIKVGHHGSSTSTSRKVYGELDIAFLAVSHSHKYGNPDPQLLENVEDSQNFLYSTYYHGELVFDGKHITSYLNPNGKVLTTKPIRR